MRVEPNFGNTFGAGRVTPAGTIFYMSIVTKADGTAFGFFLCGVPCTTAVLQISWLPQNITAGDELSGFAPEEGQYYLWGQDVRTRGVDKPVSDNIRGDKLRITFESGAVIDAWYVLP